MHWSSQDQLQLEEHGLRLADVEEQLLVFKSGLPFADLVRPCTLGDGILRLQPDQISSYQKSYTKAQMVGRCSKFVPASGAASRMFKELLNYYNSQAEAPVEPRTQEFFTKISQFAFYPQLKQILQEQGKSLAKLLESKRYREILQSLLMQPDLDYAQLPKGLLSFHQYPEGSRTAFAEQLIEALAYLQDEQKKCRIHFTISLEHQNKIEAHFKELLGLLQTAGIQFDISFSVQSPASDTIAVDLDNQPFRNAQGQLLFRPGGHGALIENLNQVAGDMVFIKNIDNVVVDDWKPEMTHYKKVLGGLLVELQEQIFKYLHRLEVFESQSQQLAKQGLQELEEMRSFVITSLGVAASPNFLGAISEDAVTQIKKLKSVLHRPLRVCGMVKNQGEPGGGPFWLKLPDASVSCQIVESAQVDLNNSQQKEIFQQATHFNPVDLVCGLKDHRGELYDLKKYVDPKAGFIAEKSKEGRSLKALELPGLWNGAMAYWNTVFVEVPASTFQPVKTVYDLLRPAHQREGEIL